MRTEAQDTTPASTFSAVRLRRNLAPGTDVGAFYYARQGTEARGGRNEVFGIDENVRFFGKVDWNSYLVGSQTPGKGGGQFAWRSSVNYESKIVHVRGAVMELGDGFEDDLGYYRRTGVRKYFLDFGFRPRPAWWQQHGTRELHPHVTWNYYENLTGTTIGKNLQAQYEKTYGPGVNYIPYVPITYWGFRLMIGLGMLAALYALWALFAIRGGRTPKSKFFAFASTWIMSTATARAFWSPTDA